jgi:hypothetical protein
MLLVEDELQTQLAQLCNYPPSADSKLRDKLAGKVIALTTALAAVRALIDGAYGE